MWNVNLEKERNGHVGKNAFGSIMIIENYINARNVLVRFVESGYSVLTTWRRFSNGSVRNVYDKSVYGIGYLGEGDCKTKEDSKDTRQYISWHGMISRCYNEKYHDSFPSYKECSVAPEWHNFQNFAKWYNGNFYQITNEKMCLDKDILKKGNKVYSPETCIFVPERINVLFTKSNSIRGDLPIGVRYYESFGKYTSRCSNGKGKAMHLGSYNSPKEAFQVYKIHKEKYIKKVAEEYKENIPKKLYEAMLNYQVEITD